MFTEYGVSIGFTGCIKDSPSMFHLSLPSLELMILDTLSIATWISSVPAIALAMYAISDQPAPIKTAGGCLPWNQMPEKKIISPAASG
ncbi:hypothetical protein FQZ97_604690 [compost metagenome]